MNCLKVALRFLVVFLSLTLAVSAQQTASTPPFSAVPRLVKYSGVLKDAAGQPRSGTVGLTLAIYAEQEGGATLWLETQNAELDEQGRYTVLLGAQTKDGLPLDLFASGEPRWLGVQVNLPGEVEQARVLLVSVPYALKAADAETLGGKPATDYLLRAPLSTGALTGTGLWQSAQQAPGGIDLLTVDCTTNCTTNFLSKFSSASTITSSILFDTGAEIGINTTSPSNVNREIVSVNGNLALFGQQTHQIRMSGTASSGRLGQDGVGFFFATDTAGKSMRILTDAGTGLTAWLNVYGNGNVGIGTAEAVPTAHKLEVAGGNLKITGAGNGVIFPDGTVMSSATTGVGGGTITGVTAGTGLTGGGTAGGVTLSLLTSCVANQILRWSGTAWVCSNDVDTDSGGDITDVQTPFGGGLQGGVNIGDVSLSMIPCGVNEVLQRSGGAWVCTPNVTNVTGTAPIVVTTPFLQSDVRNVAIDLTNIAQLNQPNTFTGINTFASGQMFLGTVQMKNNGNAGAQLELFDGQGEAWKVQPTTNNLGTLNIRHPSGLSGLTLDGSTMTLDSSTNFANLRFSNNGTRKGGITQIEDGQGNRLDFFGSSLFPIMSLNEAGVLKPAGGVMFADGSMMTTAALQGSGTVTSVATGAGLTGGPITTAGTISIASGGVVNSMLQNSSFTVNGGVTVPLGGALSLTGTAPIVVAQTGPTSINWSLAGGTFAQLDTPNTFAADQTLSANLAVNGTTTLNGPTLVTGSGGSPALSISQTGVGPGWVMDRGDTGMFLNFRALGRLLFNIDEDSFDINETTSATPSPSGQLRLSASVADDLALPKGGTFVLQNVAEGHGTPAAAGNLMIGGPANSWIKLNNAIRMQPGGGGSSREIGFDMTDVASAARDFAIIANILGPDPALSPAQLVFRSTNQAMATTTDAFKIGDTGNTMAAGNSTAMDFRTPNNMSISSHTCPAGQVRVSDGLGGTTCATPGGGGGPATDVTCTGCVDATDVNSAQIPTLAGNNDFMARATWTTMANQGPVSMTHTGTGGFFGTALNIQQLGPGPSNLGLNISSSDEGASISAQNIGLLVSSNTTNAVVISSNGSFNPAAVIFNNNNAATGLAVGGGARGIDASASALGGDAIRARAFGANGTGVESVTTGANSIGVTSSGVVKGVTGTATATTGTPIGMEGTATSGTGIGMKGTGAEIGGDFLASGISGSPVGVKGTATTTANGVGMMGNGVAAGGSFNGVLKGVDGTATDTSGLATGVKGTATASLDGIGVDGMGGGGGGIGVRGTGGTGVEGSSVVGFGIGVSGTASDLDGIGGHFTNTNPGGIALVAGTTGTDIFKVLSNGTVLVNGNLTVTGTKNNVVALPDGRRVLLNALETPDNWYEDFGRGELRNGAARISLDATFTQTVNTNLDYHVFLTPRGDCRGLYVAKTTATDFEVRELGGGKSNVAFDYRIVAKRRGYEHVRLAEAPAR